jgi:outer membrane lipoprotein SlyB
MNKLNLRGARNGSAARTLPILSVLALSACATYPPGPSVMVLPGQTTSFEQFQYDDFQCQTYARNALGQPGARADASESAVDTAVAGTVIGAAAGALLGAASGNAGAGAAIGAGSGLVIGGAAGSDAYQTGGYRAQTRYDNTYIQCMYAKGHQVPMANGAQPYTQSPGNPSNTGYPPANTPPPPGYR